MSFGLLLVTVRHFVGFGLLLVTVRHFVSFGLLLVTVRHFVSFGLLHHFIPGLSVFDEICPGLHLPIYFSNFRCLSFLWASIPYYSLWFLFSPSCCDAPTIVSSALLRFQLPYDFIISKNFISLVIQPRVSGGMKIANNNF